MESEKITSLLRRERLIAVAAGLRSVVLKSLAAVGISGIVCFIFAKDIIRFFLEAVSIQIYFFTLPEVFLSALELAFYGGIFFSLPLVIFLGWKEIKDATAIKNLHGWLFILFAVLLFYGGAFFCYRIVLPSGIGFLIGYEGGAIKAMISAQRFVRFCVAMLFAFGVTFEIPVIMMFLALMGILKSKFLSKTRRFAILIIAIAAAVITPTPDVYNMMLLGVPMYVLYELGIVLVKVIEKRKSGV